MFQKNTLFLLFMGCILGFLPELAGQNGIFNPSLTELPIILSWDDDGARITANTSDERSSNLFKLTPSRYLDQVGNDLIRVAIGSDNVPVIIDLSEYYKRQDTGKDATALEGKVSVHMPKLALTNYVEPNTFMMKLVSFSKGSKKATQTFIFKGIDIFYPAVDQCAILNSDMNRITVDVDKCDVKYLVMMGGVLNLDDVEEKIPVLCRKYNDRYFINRGKGKSEGFICLKDCDDDDPNAYKNLSHSRGLITKYNITDFQDAPISFLDNMLITNKGVGLNLKTEVETLGNKKKKKNKKKETSYTTYDSYRFFPWYEFINLSFAKHIDANQLMIRDPYDVSYIYNSKIRFSNVELIQFFNELKALITDRVTN